MHDVPKLNESEGSFFKELLTFMVIALVVVFPVRIFIAQPFIVSGASMEPTFETGEYLIIDQLSFRYEAPERGEVIIFRYPNDPSTFFIKRIIGLPGETLSIRGGSIYVTEPGSKERRLDEPYLVKRGNGGDLSITLKDGEYFVMGDNRPESSDSRVWGALPEENIVGRAFLRLFPLSETSVYPGDHKETAI